MYQIILVTIASKAREVSKWHSTINNATNATQKHLTVKVQTVLKEDFPNLISVVQIRSDWLIPHRVPVVQMGSDWLIFRVETVSYCFLIG